MSRLQRVLRGTDRLPLSGLRALARTETRGDGRRLPTAAGAPSQNEDEPWRKVRRGTGGHGEGSRKIEEMTEPNMLFTPTGFYCTRCDYYFHPELDRSRLPDNPVKWRTQHHKVESFPFECPLVGKWFEIDVTEVFPEARKIGI